jgi:BrnA antitoxin of type II toxin-antitoxin system
MKPKSTGKKFPSSEAQWDALIAQAPERVPDDSQSDAYDPNDPVQVEAFWKDGVAVKGGGLKAVRAALDERRRVRGRQKAPTKVLLSVRYSPQVVDYFRATGEGWQARMDEALKEWIRARVPR